MSLPLNRSGSCLEPPTKQKMVRENPIVGGRLLATPKPSTSCHSLLLRTQILVDLLLASRHVPSSIDSPASSSTSSKRGVTPPSLTSAILDTMLCILVDSTPALRAFEECNGVQAIVKILKRAGSPREVR